MRQAGVDADNRTGRAEHVHCIADRRRPGLVDPEGSQLLGSVVSRDHTYVRAEIPDGMCERGPPRGGPLLRGSVGAGHEEDRRGDVRAGVRRHGDRRLEVGSDAEVGADPTEDVVDGERSETLLELRRSPPVIALEGMVAEVDEPIAMQVTVPVVFLHASCEPGDALGELHLRVGAGHQPRLRVGRARLRDQCLQHGQADDEIAEPEGDRREVDAIHPDPCLRRARSG